MNPSALHPLQAMRVASVVRSSVISRVTEAQLRSASRQRIYSSIRAEIALAAADEGIATITDVARRFGRTHSGLSRAVNRRRDQRQ